MIDDITPPSSLKRDKPKRIEPLAKPADNRPSLHELAKAEDPSFRTPEEIAGAEAPSSDEPTVRSHDTDAVKSQPWYRLTWPLTKKQQIIGGVLAVIIVFGIGVGWTLAHRTRTALAVSKNHTTLTKPAPIVYSTLTGLPVADASVNKRPVTGVMIENSIDARPQSGLSQAGVVFEAVAEGGVTRFLALYQDQVPTNVGPVRSARPYYVQWDMGFDAPYAHVGGSDAALSDISAWGVHDLNQFYNGNSYHRIASREAPHNMYTGIDTLNQLEASKGYTTSQYSGFLRKKEAASKQPTATSLDFSLSGYTYDPHYDYDSATNSYKRSEAGDPQTDANTGVQLSPKVVIAIVVPLERGELDSSGAYYSDYNVIGSGQAYVFQDGTLTTGQWSKASNTTQITFADANGKPLRLNPGQTWVTAVSDSGKVSYK